MRKFLVIFAAWSLVGCLSAPEPAGMPFDTTNNAPNNGEDDAPDAGIRDRDADVPCATCTLGAQQCETDDNDHGILQKCVEAEEANCNVWETVETCTGALMCDVEEGGCFCPGETCDPDEIAACPTSGAVACVKINGCFRPLDIGRAEGCAAPEVPTDAPSCDPDDDDYVPGMPYCGTCQDGRGCEQACDNARGWTCGLIGPGDDGEE